MVPKVKKDWIKALRSGKYKQGTGALLQKKDDGDHKPGYCCLGVLTDLYCKEKKVQFKNVTKNEKGILPPAVMKWAGLDEQNPRIDGEDASVQNDDNKLNFRQIARLIEKSL